MYIWQFSLMFYISTVSLIVVTIQLYSFVGGARQQKQNSLMNGDNWQASACNALLLQPSCSGAYLHFQSFIPLVTVIPNDSNNDHKDHN